ncbi:MAG: PP2C family protein-serine/threonine phosphatase [Lachnospiraceae bacterium]
MQTAYTYTTNVGGKQRNQDSLLVLQAETEGHGQVTFAAICDGMGGLSKGELSSAEVISSFRRWFCESLPSILRAAEGEDFNYEVALRFSWKKLLTNVNRKLLAYGKTHGCQLGTTAAGILLLANAGYILNVGDSRVYRVTESKLEVLTHDQTLAMAAVDRGELPLALLEGHPQGNVLLSCIGANETVDMQFLTCPVEEETVFLVCSDGFRHRLLEKEIQEAFLPSRWTNTEEVRLRMEKLVEEAMKRGERDNITAIALRCVPR